MIRPIPAILLIAVAAAADKPALEPEIKEFLGWYRTYQGSINPMDAIRAYSERLSKQGVAEPEIGHRLKLIQTALRTMPVEFTALHFDKIFGAAKAPFSQEPSHFLIRIAEGLKPGTALDVGMGQGRNALYLAAKGWQVTGYDISDKALKLAQDSARNAGLKLNLIKASHDGFDYGKERWDLIVQAFAFTQLSDYAYRKRVVGSLKPGGVLLIEGFGGGPKNEMLKAFGDLRVIYYEDRDDIADWSLQKARLARIAVQKD